ncbi:MAG: filamentous hemagglutinin N-terminal domain-containing protein, partial [Planctomycetota bacterium]|nr:filamentous hemagglutinin N-terminal domain-containing protein [Planctomycetota bacterium]
MKKTLVSLAITSLFVPHGIVFAAPEDGRVVAGKADIRQQGKTTVIEQTSKRSIINWKRFDIGANERVRHDMPDADSHGLHRVTGGGGASQLAGELKSNGNVYLVNPAGAVIHRGAKIDVGGFLASTRDLADENFMRGRMLFDKPGQPGASIVNRGQISVRDSGFAALVAPTVRNDGVIVARLGKVALASGEGYALDFYGDELITFTTPETAVESLYDLQGRALGVENTGTIKAEGGVVLLTASQMDGIVGSVVNNGGTISAASAELDGGKIVFKGEGAVKVAGGTLDASASGKGNGGFIETSGANVEISDDARITTQAANGRTGTWLIDPNDYIIAASGGNMTGANLSNHLGSNNVEIATATMGTPGGNGDIFVNDAVSWSANTTLTLTAERGVIVNRAITATGANAGLSVNYDRGGSGEIEANFYVYASVNLPASGTLAINGMKFTLIDRLEDITNLDGRYALRKDINSDIDEPIGSYSNPFAGTLEGLGHMVNGLTMDRGGMGYMGGYYVGLFGMMSGTVRNLGLEGGGVTGGNYVGMLAGENRGGEIINSYATGDVSGDYYVGGLVGSLGDSTITQSYATGEVNGDNCVGGLVGGSLGNSTITQS